MGEASNDLIAEIEGADSTLEKLVQKIIDTDDKAQQMIADAKRQRSSTAATVSQRKEELRAQLTEQAERRIENAEAAARRRADTEVAEQAELFRQAAERLEADFSANHDKWLEEIIADITAVD